MKMQLPTPARVGKSRVAKWIPGAVKGANSLKWLITMPGWVTASKFTPEMQD
jgi:hypothetical protein